jgi:uncharacterized protein involved in exopolysaccharide biosynthesis/Mrp family chromosome partitioning ATPase
MAKTTTKPEPSGLSLGDVFYVLGKHKWKIIVPTLLALAAGAAYYFRAPVFHYESNAKLLVRYVLNRNAIDDADSTSTPGSTRGVDSVMNSQVAILTSRDLARTVVEALKGRKASSGSPQDEDGRALIEADPKFLARIAPGYSGIALDTEATTVIMENLIAEAPRGGNILDLTFKHKDPEVATRVLDYVVKQYLAVHLAIYRSKAAAAEILVDVSRSEDLLRRTEGDLLSLRAEKEILTLEGAIASLNTEMSEARTQLSDAVTRLAEQRARVASFEGASPVASTPAPDKIDTQAALPEPGGAAPAVAPASDNPASATPATAGLTRNPLMLNGTVTKYAAILTRLDALRSSNVALLAKYTSGSEAVQLNEAQIAAMEKEQQTLEQQHPELPSLIRGPAGAASPILDMMAERASLKAAEVRKDNLEASLEALKVRRAALIKDAPIIAQAERNQAINEENLKYLMTSKKKAEVDQKLSTDNIPNIDIIQAATPAKENEALRTQIALGIAGGGPALAMSLVLLFGLLLSPTVKRPAEFEARFGAPVMMSIPWFKEAQRLAGPEVPRLKDGKNGKDSGGPMTPWDADHSIRPYCEVMRDRLGLYFDLNGLHHKPKMIAVAGASAGCGASTLAGGLAAALSKTGDGKVLLVDMNLSQGAAHPFSDGHPATSLDVAVKSPRGLEATADNLYVAKAEADSPGGVSLGLGRLSRLVPELLASKFDYIVFDMPPLSATSPTSALAGVMDHVMVVVEPEKSTHDHLRRSIRDLNDSRAKVSYVFNKARPHGPAALSGI